MVEQIEGTNKEKLENQVMQELKAEGYLDKYPNTKVTFVTDNVFALQTNELNVSMYVDINGDVIFNIGKVAKQHFFNKAQQLSGFIEKKTPDGKYHLYRIKRYDPKSDSFELGEEIDKYSIEYYNAWKDIIFYINFLGTEALRVNGEGGYTKVDKKWVDISLSLDNDLRIFQIVDFLKHGQIDQKLFDYTLKKINTPEYLIAQIIDERFWDIGKKITQQELEDYYTKGYIDGDTFTKCLNALEDFIQEREKKKACAKDTRECVREMLKGIKLGD